MTLERLAWLGNLILSGTAIYLAWVPVSSQLGKWAVVVIAGLSMARVMLCHKPFQTGWRGYQLAALLGIAEAHRRQSQSGCKPTLLGMVQCSGAAMDLAKMARESPAL
jgi:hypothetical protein